MASSGFQQPAETHLIKYSLSTIYRYFKSGGTKSLYCQPFFFLQLCTIFGSIQMISYGLAYDFILFFCFKELFQSRHYNQNQKQISSQFKSWLCFVGLRIWYWRCTGWGWPSPVRAWRRHGHYATPSRRRGVVPGFAGRFELPPGSPIASWSADLIKIWIKGINFQKKKRCKLPQWRLWWAVHGKQLQVEGQRFPSWHRRASFGQGHAPVQPSR